MKQQIQALESELIKNKYANILWATFIAFGLAPVMGGVVKLIVQDPEALAKTGGLAAKAQVIDFEGNWKSYFGLLTQAVGVGGVMVFGFVASWIFGREYSDGTAKDLLALPVSRTKIINAKFMVYTIWCFALTLSNLLVGLLIGTIMQIPLPPTFNMALMLENYFLTTLLTVLIGTPIEITERHTRINQKLIKAAPEYWLWTHRRWKHKRS